MKMMVCIIVEKVNKFIQKPNFPDSSGGKNLPAVQEAPRFDFWVGKIPWRRDRLPTPVFLGFPGGSAGKESACNVRDLGLIPGLGRSSGEGKGYPLQYSGLENSMDCIVHGAAKSQTWLSDFNYIQRAVKTPLWDGDKDDVTDIHWLSTVSAVGSLKDSTGIISLNP